MSSEINNNKEEWSNNMKKKESIPDSLPEIKLDDMRKKRSVRTTFNLYENTHENLNWLSDYNKITMKEVFDSLLEYKQILWTVADAAKEKFDDIGEEVYKDTVKTRKTYVISKDALQTLTKISQETNVSRDSLLEYQINLIKNIAESAREELIENHKKALELIEHYYWGSPEIEDMLGYDDPVSTRFRLALGYMDNLIDDIKNELNNGVPVEE